MGKNPDTSAPVRLLLVDDFAPFRQVIHSMLKKRPELQVVGEASDGLEAVQKAEELQPDLILLDIGLPKQNGIEAARRIRKLAPECKILFVSQESSAEVVQEALSLGAAGYVLKAQAGSELLVAVEAVLQGKQFVSTRLASHLLANVTDDQAPDLLPPRSVRISRQHQVHFYSDDALLLDGFTDFIESALKAGDTVIVVATESHQKSLLQGLQAHDVDTAAAIQEGRYLPFDVAELLSKFTVTDLPDPVRFLKIVGDLIVAATKGAKHPRVAACGA